MNKIVPFKKEITFKSMIYEITSIALDHNLKIEQSSIVGNLIISGDYKIAPSSINSEEFKYELPFEITMDEKYDLQEAKVDINDFYYEVINDTILEVNVEIIIDKIKETLYTPIEIKEEIEPVINIEIEKREDKMVENSKEIVQEKNEPANEENELVRNENIKSLFDNFDDSNENFVSYKVYIIREGDSIESILTKYEIEKEILASYNDLTEIKIGDKLIIPNTINATN